MTSEAIKFSGLNDKFRELQISDTGKRHPATDRTALKNSWWRAPTVGYLTYDQLFKW